MLVYSFYNLTKNFVLTESYTKRETQSITIITATAAEEYRIASMMIEPNLCWMFSIGWESSSEIAKNAHAKTRGIV